MRIEKKANQLEVGDRIVGKNGGRKYDIVELMASMKGFEFPYLTLRSEDGKKIEHDTAFDSESATYTIEPKVEL